MVAGEMTSHMAKEERRLFPSIAELAAAARDGRPAAAAPFGPVEHPIRMMEEEHESAAERVSPDDRLAGCRVDTGDGRRATGDVRRATCGATCDVRRAVRRATCRATSGVPPAARPAGTIAGSAGT